jgi:predicted Zn-dependent protease
MMLLFVPTLLLAKSEQSCYTVQLISKHNSTKNLDMLSKIDFPESCKLMQIGSSITVRCGCFEKVSSAKDLLNKLKKDHKQAVLATTYKYRFEDNNKFKKKDTKASEHSSKLKNKQTKSFKDNNDSDKEDEELKLMLNVFLYKSDLENAYKVASIGYKKNKRSFYWNKKMAEICQWTNRSARSMKHLRIMYELNHDEKIEDELIEYGIQSYQYEEIEPLVINKVLRDPSEKNIDLLILVYTKIGFPEKVVEILREQYNKYKNPMFLTKALELSLEIGDLDLAKKYVNIIEKNRPYTKKDAILIAKYHYITHDIVKAYNSLSYVDNTEIKKDSDNNIKYYQFKSDLGWYLQDNLNAAKASKHLMDLNKARLADYERVSFVYQKKNPKLAAEAVKRAYKEYKLSYLFYSYANEAINNKNYTELNELLNTIDVNNSDLAKEALFWIIKSKVYAHYKNKELEKEALLKALFISPDDYQIKLTLLWSFMEVNDHENLKLILQDMSEHNDLDSSFYLPIASAYFYLQDINRASFYIQELLYLESPVTKLIEFKFLQAYIYQMQNNESSFIKVMQEIKETLKEKAKSNPKLKKQNEYLSNYLRASMYIMKADKFEKKLKKAKKYLSKKNYDEISYSWAIKNAAYEKSLKIYNRMKEREIWVKFSNSLVFQNHTNIENMLDHYLNILAIGDASQAAHKDGQISLAQTMAFDWLLKNDNNQNAYIKHLDLSKEYSDKFDMKVSSYNRQPLVQKYINIKNKTYLQNAWYLYTGINYFNNSTLDKNLLLTVPSSIIEVNVKLKKIFNRGYIEAEVEYHDAMRSYMAYFLKASRRMSTDLLASISFSKNKNALEGTQLLLGGKKDMFAVDVIWNILNSTSINFSYEKNSYYSQDNVDLGDGGYGRLNLSHQIRNGYPDLSIGVFYDFGEYDETIGSKGIINKLQGGEYNVLPSNFYNIGLKFSYGMANSNLYTRVWRPYFEFYPYYNSDTQDYTYGLHMGYGGKFLHQDHLSIGASYTNSVSGVGGSVFELFLNYRFLYHHP